MLFRSVLLATVGGALCTFSSAHAAPDTGNYQVAVQVTNGPFSYGGNTLPQYQATLTASSGTTLSTCTGSTFVTLTIDSDPGDTWGANSQSAPAPNTCVYTFNGMGWNNYTPGVRTATAEATVGGQVVATASVTFTVNKVVTSISCFVNTPGPNFQTGSTLQVVADVQGPSSGYTPDWTQSTFDVTFTGPQSVTYTNVTPDTAPGTGWLTVRAPATPGQYNMTCTFDGYGEYAPSTSGNVPEDISAFNAVGGVALYTNPTTYNPNKSCDMYIVVHAAPGGPTPTGSIAITIGPSSTALIALAADGTVLVHLGPPLQWSGNQINVFYYGDPSYRSTSTNFSFTNPPIPGSGDGGGSGGGSPQATASATASATTTPAATGTQYASAGTSSSGSSSGSSGSGSSGGSPLLWIFLAVFVLGLSGGGLAFVVRARRRTPQFSVPLQASHTTGWPQSPDEPPAWPPAGRSGLTGERRPPDVLPHG